jgi:uncharacterized protein YodC (DUF2158 family)
VRGEVQISEARVKALKIGDVVVLKSGSDEMTIESIRKDGRVVCVYTDRRDRFWRRALAPHVLEHAQT